MLFIVIIIILLYSVVLIKFANSIYYFDNNLINNFSPNVSIIIAAKNEEKNIEKLMESLANQNYPVNKFEILIANDQSIDKTLKLLKSFQGIYSNLKILNIKNTPIGWSSKKWALSQLINMSSFEIILQTDADCRPSKNWIKTIVGEFSNDKVGFVCGASPLIHHDKLLNNVFQMESLIQESVNAGAILNNMVISCTGRNIAFRKKLFKSINGYSGTEQIISGDDDLLLQKIAIESNCLIKYCMNQDSLVDSYAPLKFSEFIKQRLRFASKGLLYYKIKTTIELRAVVILLYLTNFLFLTSILLLFQFSFYLFIIPIALKIISDLLLSLTFILKINRNWSLLGFFILTLLHPIYIVLFGFLGPFIKVNWKDNV